MEKAKRRTRVISLSTKTTLIILAIALLLAAIAIVISYTSYVNAMDEHYKKNATSVAKTAAAYIDGDIIAEYLNGREVDEAYEEMLRNLFIIKDNNDIKWLYVEQMNPDGVVYIMDADVPEEAVPLGTSFGYGEGFEAQAESMLAGNPSEPTITNGEYGWLVSIYYPVFNSEGACTAHVGVDISMDQVMADRYAFLITILASMGITSLVLAIIFLIFMRRSIVLPINRLASAATNFVTAKDTAVSDAPVNDSPIEQLYIHTGDEIENLYNAISQMEKDINDYIDHLTSVTAEKERIGAELDVATKIQGSMLPCIFPPYPGRKEFDIYASMEPAKEVGGDFYDFFLLDEHRIAVVIADVSGKGVPAALFMVVAKTLIKNYAHLYDSPAEVFNAANTQLCENNEAEMFVTAFMGFLDLRDGSFTYVNAGHNLPLIRHGDGRFEWLQSSPGFVLAGLEDMRYQEGQLTMAPGDCLFLYTDGVTEALNRAQELYGDERLEQTLNRLDVRFIDNPDRLLSVMRQDILQFSNGAEQADDITMLALQYNEYSAAAKPVEAAPAPAEEKPAIEAPTPVPVAAIAPAPIVAPVPEPAVVPAAVEAPAPAEIPIPAQAPVPAEAPAPATVPAAVETPAPVPEAVPLVSVEVTIEEQAEKAQPTLVVTKEKAVESSGEKKKKDDQQIACMKISKAEKSPKKKKKGKKHKGKKKKHAA